jgi:ABC-type multidrug transport system fused ATPase/permease subunit
MCSFFAPGASGRIFDLLDTQPQLVERGDALSLKPLQRKVEFRNVTFGYDPVRRVRDQYRPVRCLAFPNPARLLLSLCETTRTEKSALCSIRTDWTKNHGARCSLHWTKHGSCLRSSGCCRSKTSTNCGHGRSIPGKVHGFSRQNWMTGRGLFPAVEC